MDELGQMPLPPYIHETLEDRDRYQTVYAREEGSAAAPTAGLHFTKELLASLQRQGVYLAYVTLHVGLGTFRPVKADRIEDHEMHSEYYCITPEALAAIMEAKAAGGRVIAVETTSCRTWWRPPPRRMGPLRPEAAGQTSSYILGIGLRFWMG